MKTYTQNELLEIQRQERENSLRAEIKNYLEVAGLFLDANDYYFAANSAELAARAIRTLGEHRKLVEKLASMEAK